jgi:6,7-dimethyl-8-ribityllumazine synthase
MATALKNLSDYDPNQVPSAAKMQFAIVVAEWNPQITNALCNGAVETLKKHGAKPENINIHPVPGTFELTFGAANLIESSTADAIICLGCVIRGDTPHFDYVCQGVTQGITMLNAKGDKPVIFGVLTTDNYNSLRPRRW